MMVTSCAAAAWRASNANTQMSSRPINGAIRKSIVRLVVIGSTRRKVSPSWAIHSAVKSRSDRLLLSSSHKLTVPGLLFFIYDPVVDVKWSQLEVSPRGAEFRLRVLGRAIQRPKVLRSADINKH